MFLETDDRDRGERPPELELPSGAASGYQPASSRHGLSGRAPGLLPQQQPGAPCIAEGPPSLEHSRPEKDRERGDELLHPKPRHGRLRRHPLAFILGLLLFILASAASYLVWDYARHFQSTDDAFIAARQRGSMPSRRRFPATSPTCP
jgi:membrane fusion protein, multidrug efflux system